MTRDFPPEYAYELLSTLTFFRPSNISFIENRTTPLISYFISNIHEYPFSYKSERLPKTDSLILFSLLFIYLFIYFCLMAYQPV